MRQPYFTIEIERKGKYSPPEFTIDYDEKGIVYGEYSPAGALIGTRVIGWNGKRRAPDTGSFIA